MGLAQSSLHAGAAVARRLGLPGVPEALKSWLGWTRYRPPTGPAACLPPAFFAPVERAHGSAADKPGNAIYDDWVTIPGGHKWLHYFEIYEQLLQPLRGRPIRLLEIGVYHGASLQAWRRYLHRDAVIVGIDIDPSCAAFDAPGENIHVRIGDQADAGFLARVVREFGPFDVILDDGSHVCSQMIASFSQLFLDGLDDDGLYIAEDTHSNFWPGYRDRRYSFIDLCKDLVDVMHCHYAVLHSELDYRLEHEAQVPSLAVPRISAQIREIRFFDSIVVIRKRPIGALPATQHL